jgi:CRP/FNR family cyclic AMP-dependent transcriptional regulator
MNKLTLIDRAFFLKRLPIFSTLDLDILLAIADKLHVVNFEEGQIIFGVNEDAHRMYFIVKGRIEIRVNDQSHLAFLEHDDYFGEEALFSEQPRSYEAISKSDSIVMALSKTNLLSIISECPGVAVGLLQAYTRITPFRIRK